MKNFHLGLLLLGTLTLASCGQQAASSMPAPSTTAATVAEQIAQFAQRPELQSEEAQAILKAYPDDAGMLDALQRAYGLKPDTAEALAVPVPDGLSAQATRLSYVQSVAWGSVANYQAQKARPAYSGLNWGSDGCSAPSGVGLGYRTTFRPACDVHDFGYGNLPKLTAKSQWETQRKNTDVAFHNNMDHICAQKSWYEKPTCYAASQAYYLAVRNFGGSHWN